MHTLCLEVLQNESYTSVAEIMPTANSVSVEWNAMYERDISFQIPRRWHRNLTPDSKMKQRIDYSKANLPANIKSIIIFKFNNIGRTHTAKH